MLCKKCENSQRAYCVNCGHYQWSKLKGTGTMEGLCDNCGSHTLNLQCNPHLWDKTGMGEFCDDCK